MFLLDRFTLDQLRQWRRRTPDLLDYHWAYYSSLAQQRARILDRLKASLIAAATPFEFRDWQRIVDYPYALHPLSAVGSRRAAPGGRFNIGEIDPIKFPKFASLYVGSDFATAFREKFGVGKDEQVEEALSAEELALASGRSLASLAVEGALQSVLDLRGDRALVGFTELIARFRLPGTLRARAISLGFPPPVLARRARDLRASFLSPDWRVMPVAVDVPANSQLLGQIAHAAGIEAILYPSVRGEGLCLAIFPENILAVSYVQLMGGEGQRPRGVVHWRLDEGTKGSFA